MPRPRTLRRADMLKKVRAPAPKRSRRKTSLYVEQILAWADAHFAGTGRWPAVSSGEVMGVPWEKWRNLDNALRYGLRGIPKGLSLAALLWKHRGARNRIHPPRLTIKQILAWVDEHRTRTGEWPGLTSGPVHQTPGESWAKVDGALRAGGRGLPPGGSLARLLYRQRGVRNVNRPPALTLSQIVYWADEHHARTGRWPHSCSGIVPGTQGENWEFISQSLALGTRRLPRGWTLTRLLHERRGARMLRSPPRLDTRKILRWADDHHHRTGKWPQVHSGALERVPDENWRAIDACLRCGLRGLSGGSSLARLLERERGESVPADRSGPRRRRARTPA